ncbi:MAG: glutaredoxin family protein [Armatimonadota bacterium]|nr:glutaredoxin family protein [Armatimonadota bacterium]MDR7549954.1 glutaredoxin family protein [Armatimonadota bacterium]
MKEFLRQQGIAFVDKDVSADDQALDELIRMGFSATPVTVIDGEAVVGFNKAKLEELLGV